MALYCFGRPAFNGDTVPDDEDLLKFIASPIGFVALPQPHVRRYPCGFVELP